jgi:hypothetical protein
MSAGGDSILAPPKLTTSHLEVIQYVATIGTCEPGKIRLGRTKAYVNQLLTVTTLTTAADYVLTDTISK